jgi:hypothetical protein
VLEDGGTALCAEVNDEAHPSLLVLHNMYELWSSASVWHSIANKQDRGGQLCQSSCRIQIWRALQGSKPAFNSGLVFVIVLAALAGAVFAAVSLPSQLRAQAWTP